MLKKMFLDIHYVRNEYIIFLREAFRESTPFYIFTDSFGLLKF